MAKNETKHKSKYTEPKDMAKSLKPETRKDLKDYIKDLVRDCMWEFSGEILDGPRKNDKWDHDAKDYPFVHNSKRKSDNQDGLEDMVPVNKDADVAYPIKMMQDGDPKMSAHAKKAFRKNIEKDTEEYLKAMETRDGGVVTGNLKENIEKLTESQKEKLVRMYIRKKIAKVLQEQAPTDVPPVEDVPEETPPPPPEGETPPPTEETPPPPGEETPPQQQTTTGGSGLGAMQQSDQEFDDMMGEPDPAQEKEEKQQVLLDKIKNSPKEFSDVLNYFHESRKDEKMVTLGLKPLLDTINNIEEQSEYEAVLSMIKDEINKSRKEYRKRLLAKSQEQPEDELEV